MKNLSIEVILVCLLALVGCTSKQKTETPNPIYGQTMPHSAGETATKAGVPPSAQTPEMTPAPGEAPKRTYTEPPAITLVLGGAGVASFATVGLLKKFAEEGVRIDQIIATGWPAALCLGYTFLPSVHDLEWFAMRLQDKDFNKSGFFGNSAEDRVSALLESTFGNRDLAETQQKVPVIFAVPSTENREGELIDHGDWREPLARSFSFPGIYRNFSSSKLDWIDTVHGLNVDEAVHRGARTIVAVNMYEDYVTFLKNVKNKGDEATFRKRYLTQLGKSLHDSIPKATIGRRVTIKRSPDDFGAKRAAIRAGYLEATAIIKELKRLQ